MGTWNTVRSPATATTLSILALLASGGQALFGSGKSLSFDKADLRTTPAPTVKIGNPTAATAPVPVQDSPLLQCSGSGYDTDDGVSRTLYTGWYAEPTTGATPAATMSCVASADGTTWTDTCDLEARGLILTGDLAVNGDDITGAAGAATVFNTAATSVAIGGGATGNVDLGGGSGSTGCTCAAGTGDFMVTGDLVGVGLRLKPATGSRDLNLAGVSVDLADEGSYMLDPVTTNAYCVVQAGPAPGTSATYLTFMLTNNGVVQNLGSVPAGTVISSSVDGKLCLGTQNPQEPLEIRNRTGSPITVNLMCWYD